MIKRVLILAALVLALSGGASAGWLNGDSERTVTLEELPSVVKATILEEADGQEILEIEEIRKGDTVFYEAEWIEKGMEFEISVALDGSILDREIEDLDADEDHDDADDEDDDD